MDRDQTRSAPRTRDDAGGVVLRATHSGALVLETANARRRTPPLVKDEPGDAREEAHDTPGVPGEE